MATKRVNPEGHVGIVISGVTQSDGSNGGGFIQGVTLMSPAGDDGLTAYSRIATADANLAAIKASAGTVYGLSISNTNAAARYFKLYNKATAPVLASDTPVLRIGIPAGQTVQLTFPMGIAFSAGIAMAAVADALDNGTTGISLADLMINVLYA